MDSTAAGRKSQSIGWQYVGTSFKSGALTGYQSWVAHQEIIMILDDFPCFDFGYCLPWLNGGNA